MNLIRGIIRRFTLRTKLVMVFLVAILITLGVNAQMYSKTSNITQAIQSVYDSNVSISQLQETLGEVHESLYHYLDGSYNSLSDYYQSESNLRKMARNLNGEITDDPMKLKEKNIRNMIGSYLEITDSAVAAYRGTNVGRYSSEYENACQMLSYLSTNIEELNSGLFEENTANASNLSAMQGTTQLVNFLLMVLCALIELLVIILFTDQLTYPLTLLSGRAQEVGEGRLDLPALKVYNEDEVGQVTGAFNRMTVQLNEHMLRQQEQLKEENRLKEEQLRLEAELKEAQLGALQSQINPHFLYNTLNAGEQLALMEDAERTCLFLERVSDYFRYNLRRSGGDVTLAEELTQAENYLYIMNTRFDGEIAYTVEAGEIPQIRLPGMILQPLVENAIEHGLRQLDGEKHLYLTVGETEEHVIVSVADNGTGFPREKADKLLAPGPAQPVARGGHGIGMLNVLRRLRLYYGRADVMEIGSMADGTGTEIRLLLPKGGKANVSDHAGG